MQRPDPGLALSRSRVRATTIASLCLVFLLPSAASSRSYELRYGLAPGQTWHAVQTIFRETTVAGLTRTDRNTARFRYETRESKVDGLLRLDASMLSQTMDDQQSPFDFSVIRFLALTDMRGTMRGVHFQIGEAEPPELPGLERDPVAYRQMLRSVAAAWLDAVYWLPELPERPIEVGEAFVVSNRGDVGGTNPGVSMQIESTTTFTLRKVTGPQAEFAIQVRSTVDAATALAGIVSNRLAEGEAVFDLELGMWKHQETRSDHRVSLSGAPGAEQGSARTVTTIEMALGEPPEVEPPVGRVGL